MEVEIQNNEIIIQPEIIELPKGIDKAIPMQEFTADKIAGTSETLADRRFE